MGSPIVRGRHTVKPLVSALALALGAAGCGIAADASAGTTPHPRIQALLALQGQYRQWHQQHGNLFFANVKRHHLARPGNGVPALQTVNTCVDDASSATTPGTLRYAVLNAVDGDTVDLGALNCSTITLTQGALPVSVNNLTLTGPANGTLAIDGNHADRVFMHTGTGTLALQHLTVRNGYFANSSGPASGGCIVSYNGAVALDHTTVSGCTAISTAASSPSASGGGVAAYVLTMVSSTLSGNTASAPTGVAGGGGAFFFGYNGFALDTSTVSGNTAYGTAALGGGLLTKYGMQARYSVLSGNVAHSIGGSGSGGKYLAAGGASFSLGGTQLLASTVTGNSAQCVANTVCVGGGIDGGKYGPTMVAYSTIDNNHSDVLGGGAVSKYSASIVQSTISGNAAKVGGGGVVLLNYRTGNNTIYNSTVAMNTATLYGGGGVYLLNDPTLAMVSTLAARNTAPSGADVYANGTAVTIAGSNDLVMASANVTLPAGTLTADPLLQPLANNGGPTRTHLLTAGSPALDAGANPMGFDFDQRGPGFPRAVGAAPDIGAAEGAFAPFVPIAVPTLGTWAMALLAGLLGWLGLRGGRWRRARRE
jgi:hypothetical protein